MEAPNIYSNYVVDTNPGTSGAVSFKRSYECSKCHLGFKEQDITFFRGKAYGIPCGCARDVAKLISQGRG